MGYVENIQDAIWEMHRCASNHVESVPVDARLKAHVASGQVEVFELVNHPKAKRCYAWGYKDGSGENCVFAILEIPPVKSAQTAVMASIVAQMKKPVARPKSRRSHPAS
jgi:hypothetical protein